MTRLTIFLILACLLPSQGPRAEERSDAPSAPRAAFEVGGMGGVVIASEGKLLVFVDRVDGNEPVADARVTVKTESGEPVAVSGVSPGFFVGAFNPGQRPREKFQVSVSAADRTDGVTAEIVFARAELPSSGPEGHSSHTLLISILSGLAGLGIGFGIMRWRFAPSQAAGSP